VKRSEIVEKEAVKTFEDHIGFKMRSLILLMIVAICSAQLHEYHAESNF